jgi:hyaluronan synthase
MWLGSGSTHGKGTNRQMNAVSFSRPGTVGAPRPAALTLPDGFRAEPYTGPSTSEQLAALEVLKELAARQATPAGNRTSRPRVYPRQAAAGAGTARHRGGRVLLAGAITGVVLGVVLGMHATRLPGGGIAVHLGWYGTAVSAIIGAKLLLSLVIRPAKPSVQSAGVLATAYVAAVITLYNEDPAAFGRCLDSLLAQTRLPDAVTVVDDCSPDPACKRYALERTAEFRAYGIDYHVIGFPENLGKRDGLAVGYRRSPQATVYMCLDSDTILDTRAMERLLLPFGDPEVQAVTGCVLAANRTANLLTRLIDLRYAYSFLGERAAYSLFGAVLCVPGAGGMYRGTAVRKHLDAWLGQRFLGKACTYGDDRHMTFWCLKEGRVLLAPDAVAWTFVPERMGHFLRQQIRWSKSFFRESAWVLGRMSPRRSCWWLTLIEVVTWAVFTTALLYSLAVRPILAEHFVPWAYAGSAVLLSYARAGHYTEAEHPGMGWGARIAGVLLAPLYGMIHITLLLPLRLYALATLTDNKWGTRKKVEVEAA